MRIHDPQSQDYPAQRFAQSLSYSPKSQSQQISEEQQVSQGSGSSHFKSEQRTQEPSQLRNEIVPPSDPAQPGNEVTAQAAVEAADHLSGGVAPRIQHAPSPLLQPTPKQSMDVDAGPEEATTQEHGVDSLLFRASPLKGVRGVGVAFPNVKTADDDRQLGLSTSSFQLPQDPMVDHGAVDSSSDVSRLADDEGGPDALPSDDSFSNNDQDDQGSEPSSTEEEEEVDQLASDDARVDETIEEHPVSQSTRPSSRQRIRSPRHAPTSQRAHSPQVVPDSQTPPPTDETVLHTSHREESEGPALPLTPDVFLSRASFDRETSSQASSPTSPSAFQIRQSSHVAGSDERQFEVKEEIVLPLPEPSLASNHDPSTWSGPAFLRNRRKRSLSPTPSSSTAEDEPPKKKRKLQAVSQSIAAPVQPLSGRRVQPTASRSGLSSRALPAPSITRRGSLSSTTTKIKQIDLRRSGSVTSNASSSHARTSVSNLLKDGSSTRAPTPKTEVVVLNESGSDGRIKELTFKQRRSGQSVRSGEGSRAPTRESTAPPVQPRRADSLTGVPDRIPENRIVYVRGQPRPSQAPSPKANLSTQKVSPAKAPQNTTRAQQTEPVQAAPAAAQASRPSALGELRSALHVTQSDISPPVDWSVLADILIATGRARHKENANASAGSSGR